MIKNHGNNTASFKRRVWFYYRKHKRDLPWRHTENPYHVLVSEVMLQQTQVARVVPKYLLFLKKFPTVQKLSEGTCKEVLTLWSGLGYNRRAKMLHDSARIIVKEYEGKIPKERKILEALPGIGPYTAGAIRAFAFNETEIFIETNIRTVFLLFFFRETKDVHDRDILRHVEETLPKRNIREWYYALMDYGSMIKVTQGNLNHLSKHYTKQSIFKGSPRQLRGQIIKILLRHDMLSIDDLFKILPDKKEMLRQTLQDLVADALIVEKNDSFCLS